MSGKGLTDKETMQAIIAEKHNQLHTSSRVRELADKGLRPPFQLTVEETRELCGSVLRHIEWNEIL